eukprot:1217356-Pyramimonas_sp.AAC.1
MAREEYRKWLADKGHEFQSSAPDLKQVELHEVAARHASAVRLQQQPPDEGEDEARQAVDAARQINQDDMFKSVVSAVGDQRTPYKAVWPNSFLDPFSVYTSLLLPFLCWGALALAH